MPHGKQNKKNASGAGTIRKKTVTRNGKEYVYWEARYTVGFDTGTGKQKQKSITGKTQKEVAQKLRQVTVDIDTSTYVEPSKMRLSEWLDIWKDTYLGGVKPRTIEIYDSVIRVHIKPALGAVRLEALNTPLIQGFYNDCLKKSNLSAKSVRNVHCVMHKALQQAVSVGYLKFNPSEACTLPRVEKKELRPLDDVQIAAFLCQIQGDRMEVLLTVALFTGMREGELMGLMWDCVDFACGTITVNKQLQHFRDNGAEYRLVPTKNSKSRVIVPANLVMTLLRRRLAEQEEERRNAGSVWEDSGLVFTDELGHHLNTWNVYRAFKRAATAIGRPDARVHDCRHSYAVASIRAGDDIKTVQGNLGHATAAFTLDVYGHVTEQMKRASADRMEAYIQQLKSQ